MVRTLVFSLAVAGVSFACAGSTRWAELQTPHGRFGVDTAHARLLGDGLVETWVRELDRAQGYPYWGALFGPPYPHRRRNERLIEVDCLNQLVRAKRELLSTNERRTAQLAYRQPEWSPIFDSTSTAEDYDRAGFLYTQACQRGSTAALVSVDNQNDSAAIISLLYRERRMRLGPVGAHNNRTLPFNSPTGDFQFIIDLGDSPEAVVSEGPDQIPCRLSDRFYAEPGDTISLVIPRDLQRQPSRDLCPKP
jgi:hypothetical protein